MFIISLFKKKSNHNKAKIDKYKSEIISLFKKKSNHNHLGSFDLATGIISLFKKKSNHNHIDYQKSFTKLYHFLKRNQITTK